MKRLIYKLQNKFFRTSGNDINYTMLQKIMRENRDAVLIDVRTKEEYRNTHIEGAINIPMQEISQKISRYVKNKNDIIIVYCQYGGRSKKVMGWLNKMGFQNVYNLAGGIESI